MSAGQAQPATAPGPRKDNTALIIVVAILGACLAHFLPAFAIFGLYGMIGGGFLGYMFLLDPGEVHVVAPRDRALAVIVDKDAPVVLEPGKHVAIEMDRGRHEITITQGGGGGTMYHEVDVGSGFFDMVAPATAGQCFVRLDMTDYAYPMVRARSTSPPMPVIEERIDERTPFKVGSSTWLDEGDMPGSLESGSRAFLLVDVPCDRLAASDGEILADLGY